jgi:hypothetical protein
VFVLDYYGTFESHTTVTVIKVWSTWCPGHFTPRKETLGTLYRGWVGPRASLDGSRKSCSYWDSIPGLSSPYWVAKLTELSRPHNYCGSWYSDSLWAARSGNRNPVGVSFSAPVQTSLGTHPAFCTMDNGSLSWGQSAQDVTYTTHPHLVPRLKKEYSYTSTSPLGLHGLL